MTYIYTPNDNQLLSSKDKINERILYYYNLYDYKPLNYQIEYIHLGIQNFLNSFLYLDYVNEETTFNYFSSLYNYGTKFTNTWSLDNLIKYHHNYEFIINLDVWLGKTITSIILYNLISEIYNEIYFTLFSNYIEKYKREEVKDFYLISMNQNLREKIWYTIDSYKPLKLNLFMVSRKSLVVEFEHIFNKGHSENLTPISLYSWRWVNNYNLPEEYELENLFLDMYFYLNDFVNKDLTKVLTSKTRYLIPSKFFLVDEYGTDPVFFWRSTSNVLCIWHLLHGAYIVWLTANDSPYVIDHSHAVIGPRYLKSDPRIIEELTSNHLYSSNKDFTYKFVNISDSKAQNSFEVLYKQKYQYIKEITEVMSDLSQFKNLLKENLQTLFDDENNIKTLSSTYIEKLSHLILIYKNNEKYEEILSRQKTLLTKVNNLFEDYLNLISQLAYSSMTKIFNDSHLNYLFDKNTVIIYDEKHSSDQIKEFKSFIKENENSKLVSLDTYKELKGTWNVLIWTVKELSKWLNLQHFDNIVFWYVDNMSINDIYQGIWRLDRIWTQTDKEIILLWYNQTETDINTIIDYKDTYNPTLDITLTKEISEIQASWLSQEIIKQKEEFRKESSLIDFNTLFLSKKTEEEVKTKMKDKLEFISKNKAVFKTLLKNIETRYSEAEKSINNLIIGSKDKVSFDTNYIDSVITLL